MKKRTPDVLGVQGVSESKETKDNGTEDIATDNKIWCHEQGDGENRIHVEELVIIHIL